MKPRQTATNQPSDDITRDPSHISPKKLVRSAVLQLVVGYLLIWGGATILVVGLAAAEGLLATVLFLLGSALALVGAMVAILAHMQAMFGAVVNATEEVVARVQENQSPTPPSSSAL